jgi:hypothetical protein
LRVLLARLQASFGRGNFLGRPVGHAGIALDAGVPRLAILVLLWRERIFR